MKKFIIKMLINLFGGKKMIKAFQSFLGGYKTYIAAIGILITAIIEFTNDGDIAKLITRIFEALAAAGIRAALTK